MGARQEEEVLTGAEHPGACNSADMGAVRRLLGREPMARFFVSVRDRNGDPVVICNEPFTFDGKPMPTRWWLVGAETARAIGGLEATGGVRAAEREVDPETLRQAHLRYAQERDAAIPPGWTGPRPAGGVGGTRRGVKCLHAHYAWYLAGGRDPVGRWADDRLDRLGSRPALVAEWSRL
ncbi:MAG: DUF501 domain-containing protein [Actinomycetota bacterium]|nr:DUF501 domain-containing protein [Actinomycetota bacterium]